jgi:tRNA dimethylallyltransferase
METTLHPNILDCWFLTGATASGKTSTSLLLAEALNAEIISLDSMSIYRNMDIGTAKPTSTDQSRVPHHLIDLVAPTDTFSVSQYRDRAHEKIDELRSRGKAVLFVGGTPLYLKSLLRGIFEGPPADWEFRREIEAEIAEHGIQVLHERLKMLDPLSAHKLHPNDQRRMIRALEVYRATGQPISHLQTHFDEAHSAADCRVFALHWDRPVLHERIDQRVESMFEQGLVQEVEGIVRDFGELSHTAAQAVGYQEVISYLKGECSLEQSVDTVKQRTRQFARRQETWFRALQECRWIERTKADDPETLVDEILKAGAFSSA